MTRIILACGAAGLWLGMVLVMVGRLTIADIASGGYAVGLAAGGLLAYGIGRLVKGR